MKKILVVISGNLPIPAIRGGAVETLIDAYIDRNERTKQFHYTVYSAYSDGVFALQKKYSYAEFHYIHTDGIFYQLERILRSILIKIFRLPMDYVFIHKVIKDLKDKNSNFDLVIVENNESLILPLSKKYPGKVIFHLHNDNLNDHTTNGHVILNSLRSVYVVSKYIKSRVEGLCRDDGDTQKIQVLFNGIDIDKFRNDMHSNSRIKTRKMYGIEDDDIVFVFAGRICDDKGVLELVEAFSMLCRKFNNVKLLIAGASFFSETKKTNYVKKVMKASLPIKEKIIFSGYIEHNKMGLIYNASDVQVIPSKFDDPCPLSVLEGMAMGLPQIASKSGGIPEEVDKNGSILVDRKNLVKELLDAMILLTANSEKRSHMGKTSYSHAKEFSIDKYCDNFYNLVNKEIKDDK